MIDHLGSNPYNARILKLREQKMKYAIYRSNPFLAGGAYRPVRRNGKPVTFATKPEGYAWLAANKPTSADKHTSFEVRKFIKEVK